MNGICYSKGSSGFYILNCESDQQPSRYLNLYRAAVKYDDTQTNVCVLEIVQLW